MVHGSEGITVSSRFSEYVMFLVFFGTEISWKILDTNFTSGKHDLEN